MAADIHFLGNSIAAFRFPVDEQHNGCSRDSTYVGARTRRMEKCTDCDARFDFSKAEPDGIDNKNMNKKGEVFGSQDFIEALPGMSFKQLPNHNGPDEPRRRDVRFFGLDVLHQKSGPYVVCAFYEFNTRTKKGRGYVLSSEQARDVLESLGIIRPDPEREGKIKADWRDWMSQKVRWSICTPFEEDGKTFQLWVVEDGDIALSMSGLLDWLKARRAKARPDEV